MRQDLKRLITQTARGLRRRETPAENLLWAELRNRNIYGHKFVRQFPIAFNWRGKKRFFVTDFYCHEGKMIVELDGKIHERQKEHDQVREYVLKSMGLKVVRFTNEEIEDDLDAVVEVIRRQLAVCTPSLVREGAGG